MIADQGDGVVRRFDASYGEYMEYYEQLKLEKISKGAKTEQESMTTSKAGSTATASVTASEAPAPKKLLKLGFREKQEYEVCKGGHRRPGVEVEQEGGQKDFLQIPHIVAFVFKGAGGRD